MISTAHLGEDEITFKDRYPVYDYLHNTMKWTCGSNTPCARLSPAPEWGIPEFYFLLKFSNRYAFRLCYSAQ